MAIDLGTTGGDKGGTARGEQLALVLTGGGARAAYQVGVLRHLAQRWPELRIPILTGVSSGAINTAPAATQNPPLVATPNSSTIEAE